MKKRYKGKLWNKKGKWILKMEKIGDTGDIYAYWEQFGTGDTSIGSILRNGREYDLNFRLLR